MTTNIVQLNDIKLFTNVGLWPYSDDGVRLWSGSIRIDATNAGKLRVPEPAITTAIVTVIIDNTPIDLNLYKLDGAEELFFGTGDPEKLVMLQRIMEAKWEDIGKHQRAFENVSRLTKPIFKNAPNGLTAYAVNSSRTPTWQLLYKIVYPVVLELLQEVGDLTKEEAKRRRYHETISMEASNGVQADHVAEMVLVRLSEKLREEYKISNPIRNE